MEELQSYSRNYDDEPSSSSSSSSSSTQQCIQLVNSRIIIKSTNEDDTSNNKLHVEFSIRSGSLEIIPMMSSSSSSLSKVSVSETVQGSLQPEVLTKENFLQNHLILDHIGSYLGPKDLSSGRLTSKFWARILKHHQEVTLTKFNLKSFLKICPSSSSPATPNTVQSTPQFSKYIIKDISLQRSRKSQELFKRCGSSMTKLSLYNSASSCNELNLDVFRAILYSLTPNLEELFLQDFDGSWEFWNQGPLFNHQFPFQLLPKLRKIKLDLPYFEVNEVSVEFMTDWLDSAPHLCRFSFKGFADSPQSNQAIISALNRKSSLEALKSLEFHNLTKQELLQLTKLSERRNNRLQLSEFSLELSVSQRNPNETPHGIGADVDYTLAMSRFLCSQAQSLKYLSIDASEDVCGDSRQIINIPAMKHLQSLQLQMVFNGLRILFDGSSSILQNFPRLKRLQYYSWWAGDDDDDLAIEKTTWGKHMRLTNPVSTLSSLHFICAALKLKRLYRLAELFPNIVHLYIDLGAKPKLIGSLWNKWSRGLESLTIELDYWQDFDEAKEEEGFIDQYMTGIPKEVHGACLALRSGGTSNHSSTTKALMNQFKIMPGISDLKRLTHLQLNFNVSVNDVSAYFGFLALDSKLVTLDLRVADNLSFDCKTSIYNQLGSQAYVHLGPPSSTPTTPST